MSLSQWLQMLHIIYIVTAITVRMNANIVRILLDLYFIFILSLHNGMSVFWGYLMLNPCRTVFNPLFLKCGMSSKVHEIERLEFDPT